MPRAGTRAPCDRRDALNRLLARALLATVEPHGPEMAKDLDRLLNRKDASHYGMAFVSPGEATRMVSWARRLLDRASRVTEA